MATDLSPIIAALGDLSDAQLSALIKCTYEAPQIAPGFLAWLDTACDWEQHRRTGFHYHLLPPESAIPPEEDAVSIAAVAVLRQQFADVPAVAALFGAEVLMGGATKHSVGRCRVAVSRGPFGPRYRFSRARRTGPPTRAESESWELDAYASLSLGQKSSRHAD